MFGKELVAADGIAVQVCRLKAQHPAGPGVLRLCRGKELGFLGSFFHDCRELPVYLGILGPQRLDLRNFVFRIEKAVTVRLTELYNRCIGEAHFYRILLIRFHLALVFAGKKTGQKGILFA